MALTSQRTKSKWVKEIDTNSKYFHILIKERHNRAKISSITSVNGRVITDPKEVEAEFVSYYAQLFSTEQPTKEFDASPITKCRVSNNTEPFGLCRPFTVEDVKKALFSIPNSRAPGPDGFFKGSFGTSQCNVMQCN